MPTICRFIGRRTFARLKVSNRSVRRWPIGWGVRPLCFRLCWKSFEARCLPPRSCTATTRRGRCSRREREKPKPAGYGRTFGTDGRIGGLYGIEAEARRKPPDERRPAGLGGTADRFSCINRQGFGDSGRLGEGLHKPRRRAVAQVLSCTQKPMDHVVGIL